jgi:hypothetical protein
MKTSSCKAKGRRGAQEIKDLLVEHAENHFIADDIVVTPSGVTGPDLTLSPRAMEKFPFIVESKNQEKLNIWAAIKQSINHMSAKCHGRIPVVFFKRNHSELYVCLKATDFLKHFQRKP